MSSKLVESLRGNLTALEKVGAISKVTIRQFDTICPLRVREFSATDIKRLREGLKFSQPVFAHLLHTTASTVWKQSCSRKARRRHPKLTSGLCEQPRLRFCGPGAIHRASRPRHGARTRRRHCNVHAPPHA